MSSTVIPVRDDECLGQLRTALAIETQKRETGTGLLSEQLVAHMTELLPGYESAHLAVGQATVDQGGAVLAAQAAQDDLLRQLRGIWSDVQNRVKWKQESPVLYRYFQLSAAGVRPSLRGGRARLLAVAQAVLEGDAQAVADGFASVVGGTGFAASLTAAQEAFATVQTEKLRLSEMRQARKALRQQAQGLCGDVAVQLRRALRGLSRPEQQSVMRGYGVRFQQADTGQVSAAPVQAEDDQPVQAAAAPQAEVYAVPELLASGHIPVPNGTGNGALNGHAAGA